MSFDQPLPPFNSADPSANFLSTSCLDFLLIEIVPMAYRVANELSVSAGGSLDNHTSEDDNDDDTTSGRLGGAGSVATGGSRPTSTGGRAGTGASSGSSTSTITPNPSRNANNSTEPPPAPSTSSTTAAAPPPTTQQPQQSTLDPDEERDAVFHRLEAAGYRVGQGLVERFSRDRPRFADALDAIKFVCKDLWTLVFRKQVDNLKTNHRGVYVLTDNAFRPLARMSADPGGRAVLRAQPFLWFPCGILRGALAAMGISASVHAETSELPGAVFQIKTLSAKQ